MYVVDGWQYTRMEMPGMPSYWQKSRVSEDDLEKRDITTLVTDFSEVELLGSEMVNGTECYKLRVTPDTERLWQWSQTLEGTEGLDPTLSPEEVISDFSLIVWVAKDTYFPAKISVEITMTIEGEAMGMVMTMLIHHINEPVTIELPPEAEAAEPTNGDEGKPTVVAPRLQNPVTLDGEISGNEWDDAGQLSVTFVYTDDGSSLTYPGTIYFKHDGTYLWICIRVQDDDENRYPEMYDYAAILFDASGDGDIGPGDDSAIIHHGLGPVDLRPGEDEVWRSDTEFGGNSDVVGQSGWAAGWYTYEMRKPLNSGDTNGYDIAISPGDTILSSSSIWDAGEATAWSADAGSFYIRLEP